MSEANVSFESQLAEVVASVRKTDRAAEAAAWVRLDSLTKPPRSLGRLEEIAARIAGIQGTDHPDVGRKAIVIAAGDHGVVAEGVSPFPQDVTWQMVGNFVSGGAAINQLAASVNADVFVYDVGVARDLGGMSGIVHANVARGTRNMAVTSAMTREECAEAVLVGVQAARDLSAGGYVLLGTGEMGIGNSTAAAALAAIFTGTDVAAVVGRGTGLDDRGVARKVEAIERALLVNRVSELDALGVLAAVGGLEIAALAGVVIGAAQESVAVVSDGFIAGAATLAAAALCPSVLDVVLPSHLSAEPGHAVVLSHLGLKPVFEFDMCLGEGTGAALTFGVIDSACRMLSGMATFEEAGVSGAGG